MAALVAGERDSPASRAPFWQVWASRRPTLQTTLLFVKQKMVKAQENYVETYFVFIDS